MEVAKDEYVRITKEYPLAAARAFAGPGLSTTGSGGESAAAAGTATTANATQAVTKGVPTSETADSRASKKPPFNFIYVSGEGATHTPSRLFTPLFGTVKGETEIALAKLSQQLPSSSQTPTQISAISVRAGAVDPRHDDIRVGEAVADKKSGKRAKGIMGHTVFPALGVLMPSLLCPTDQLGRVLVELALMGDGDRGSEKGGTMAEKLEGLVVGKELVYVESVGKGKGKVVTNVGINKLGKL